MNLVLFDIDSTIVDSVGADDECFIQTFKDLCEIDLTGVDWNQFQHVTDQGLTIEIFNKWLGRDPEGAEVNQIKHYFFKLIEQSSEVFVEIDHAVSFVEELDAKDDVIVGFATGGWRCTAALKCAQVGLSLDRFISKTSDDDYRRRHIIQSVITEATELYGCSHFENIVYFGDGLWDYKATLELGLDFVGVDAKGDERLIKAGVKNVIRDYKDMSDFSLSSGD